MTCLRCVAFVVAGGQDDRAAGEFAGRNLFVDLAVACRLECPFMDTPVPSLVREATERARRAGFSLSCDPEVGRLLAVLAARLPAGARVLELGTGTGVGTAWIASALLPQAGVTVITVEKDPRTAALAAPQHPPSLTHQQVPSLRRAQGRHDPKNGLRPLPRTGSDGDGRRGRRAVSPACVRPLP